MLPGTDGLEVCRHIRRSEDLAGIPIIMLTAEGTSPTRSSGSSSAPTTTSPSRSRSRSSSPGSTPSCGGRGRGRPGRGSPWGRSSSISTSSRSRSAGTKVDLTATEFKILQLLASRKGRVFSRDQILDHLWGSEKAVIDRTIDVHIRNLREKLGPAASLIKNIRGVGYKLEE